MAKTTQKTIYYNATDESKKTLASIFDIYFETGNFSQSCLDKPSNLIYKPRKIESSYQRMLFSIKNGANKSCNKSRR